MAVSSGYSHELETEEGKGTVHQLGTKVVAGLLMTFAVSTLFQGATASPVAEFASVSGTQSADEATQIVARALNGELGVTARDLLTKANPRGEGTFVYVAQTMFEGVERYLIWVVVDGSGYALNGASKNLTPSLKWPREAPDETWEKTGLDKYSASEAIEIVFGSSE